MRMSYIQEMRTLIGQRPLITVGAGVLLSDEHDRILLQHRTDNGLWGIPGGGMEIGESLEVTARREVFEETGLEVEDLTLFGVFSGPELFYEYPNGDQVCNVSVVYLSRKFRGRLAADPDESYAVRFFEPADLPRAISPPNQPILQAYLATLQNGSLS